VQVPAPNGRAGRGLMVRSQPGEAHSEKRP